MVFAIMDHRCVMSQSMLKMMMMSFIIFHSSAERLMRAYSPNLKAFVFKVCLVLNVVPKDSHSQNGGADGGQVE